MRKGGPVGRPCFFGSSSLMLSRLLDSLRSLGVQKRGRLIPAGTGMLTYRDIYLEKDEAPAQPSLEELLQRESEDEDALSLADFDDGQ
jgi:hypothetical protein